MKNIFALQSLDSVTVRSAITRPANTTAYTAGDSVSDATGDAHFSWNIFGSHSLGPGRGEIKLARISSSGAVATSLDARLHLFHTDVGVEVDNAALTLTDAEFLTRIGILNFATADWEVLQLNSGLDILPNLPFTGIGGKVAAGAVSTKTIYGVLEARNAYVPISGEIFTIDLLVARY